MNFDYVFLVSENGLELVHSFDDYVSEMEKRSKKLIRMLGK
jgi:hypothetical protein